MAINLRPEQMREDLEAVKKDLIKSLKQSKFHFECDWDYDPDLLSGGDDEREHYAWTIAKLEEYGQESRPNYLGKIYDWLQLLPHERT